ncbi:YqcI/YcgG family protein [Caballeronia sp. LjRoot31]|uniref:YqcI/YcgG family protein n=1 Tax=Caballeronia sp. LjRoot31 TaxID=3342324 RepID=UPI003ECD4CF7
MAMSPAVEQSKAASTQWTARILNIEASNSGALPAWWRDAYHSYRKTLEQPDYPCFFGQAAERRGEMFYAFDGERPEIARATMQRFVELGHDAALTRHSLAMFCAPDPALTSHTEFLRRFWTLLLQLHEADGVPMRPTDPDDPLWEFSFGGRKMFVVGTAPTYHQRRSRVVGSGIVLLFQPRELFTDLTTGKPIGAEVRRQIHARMLEYDAMPVHPDIGFYGDPRNREWKQYCLPDDNAPVTGRCPFASR